MIDPSWLLSGVMQSTAALVAIVGGLVVSRLISLAAERSTLERQVEMLEGQKGRTERRANQLREEMVADDAATAIDDWLDALLRAENLEPSNEDLLEVMSPGDWLPDDYEPHLNALRRDFNGALGAIRKASRDERFNVFPDEDLPRDTGDLAQFGVDVPTEPEQRYIWDRVIAEWRQVELAARREKRPTLGAIFGFPTPEVLAPLAISRVDPTSRSAELARRDRDEREYRAQVAETAALDHEIKVLSTSLGETTDPRRLWWGFGVLVAFSLLGIVYPMVLMALGDQKLADAQRWVVVVAFCVGLAALFVYIATFVRDLRRRRPSARRGSRAPRAPRATHPAHPFRRNSETSQYD